MHKKKLLNVIFCECLNGPFAVGGHVTITTLNQSVMTKNHPEMERAG